MWTGSNGTQRAPEQRCWRGFGEPGGSQPTNPSSPAVMGGGQMTQLKRPDSREIRNRLVVPATCHCRLLSERMILQQSAPSPHIHLIHCGGMVFQNTISMLF